MNAPLTRAQIDRADAYSRALAAKQADTNILGERADELYAAHMATLAEAEALADRCRPVLRASVLANVKAVRAKVRFWEGHAGMLGGNGIGPRVASVLKDARFFAEQVSA